MIGFAAEVVVHWQDPRHVLQASDAGNHDGPCAALLVLLLQQQPFHAISSYTTNGSEWSMPHQGVTACR